MKNIFNAITIALLSLSITSCSNDDSTISNTTGNGTLTIKFDNAFAGNDLIMGEQPNTTSQNEVLRISTVKYIVSNIVLTKEDGTTFTYPKSQSYFIVDEAIAATQFIDLTNVPAGNYTKIKFGIGVDTEQFETGASGQGDFIAVAQSADMLWSWSAGYKFVAFEGNFTSSSVAESTPFMVHTGMTGTDYNYIDVSLTLPTKALVRTGITPAIHVVADVSKIIDGPNKIRLSEHNGMGMGAMIMGGAALPLVTQNLGSMFTIDHVHNN
ncbi:MAG: hypothetical protein EOO45_07310 [Flavobacterium sp.]|nr:MAG: hypothetical protein EOO45_07310 [Flavobacterium sp.]